MKRTIKDYNLDNIKNSEFLQILLTYTSRAQQISETQQRFHTEDNKKIIDVHFDLEGKISGISDNLSQEDFDELKKKIQSILIDGQVEKIGQSICFSHEKITGSYC